MPLKYKVQSLIKIDWLDLNRNNGPNVTKNPLPNQVGLNVNAITEESSMKIKTKVDEVKSPMDEVYKAMVRVEAILRMKAFKGRYYYCRKACSYHIIRKCEKFKELLQRMMDQ